MAEDRYHPSYMVSLNLEKKTEIYPSSRREMNVSRRPLRPPFIVPGFRIPRAECVALEGSHGHSRNIGPYHPPPCAGRPIASTNQEGRELPSNRFLPVPPPIHSSYAVCISLPCSSSFSLESLLVFHPVLLH